MTICTRHSYAGPRCCPYCGRERWKRLARIQRVRHRNAMQLALADRDAALEQCAELLEKGSLEIQRAAAELEGREIQIRTLAKEIERWQSRIVEHKRTNRWLNEQNHGLIKRLASMEQEKHEWQLGRGEKRLLRTVREVVRERMMRCEPQDWKLQGESDSRTLRQVEALLCSLLEPKP